MLCPAREDKTSVLIIDDTAKEKTGRKGENLTWFYDHCKKNYLIGYQVVVAVWHNGTVAIPLDFEFKIGSSKVKSATKSNCKKGSHSAQRKQMAKQKKTDLSIQFIKRAIQRHFEFRYILWDSWYNTSASLQFIFKELKSKGIDLISMFKRDNQKFMYQGNLVTSKAIYHRIGKWNRDRSTGILFKSAKITVLDKQSNRTPEKQLQLGEVRMCFFKYPHQKRYKIIISTDTELTEMEILQFYMKRWAVEVVFRDLKQHFGYNQSKSSKYAPQIADLTIRCVFYIMFCSLKVDNPGKSTEQLLFEFYQEMQEEWLDLFSMLIFQQQTKSFLHFAIKHGYDDVSKLIIDIEQMLIKFFEREWYEDKLVDADKHGFNEKYNRKAS